MLSRRLLLLALVAFPAGTAPLACGSSSGAAHPASADASTPDSSTIVNASPDSQPSDAALHTDAAVARRAFPKVPDTNGKTLSSPNLVTIVASNDALLAALPSFSDAVPTSQVWQQVAAEYVLGALHSTTHIVGPALASGVYTTGQIADYISAAIAGDAGPQPDGNTIYLVYLPDAATYAPPFDVDCGYHSEFPTVATSRGDQIATVRRCTPTLGGETQLGQLTRTATHEIVESATDPADKGYNLGETPKSAPWMSSIWQSYALTGHVELGDLCEGTRVFELSDGGPTGGWEYQRIWSNAAALDGSAGPCIPAPSIPYYSTAIPTDWYAVKPGATTTVPIGGWTTGATPNWLIKASIDYAGGTGALAGVADGGGVIASTLGPGAPTGCVVRAAMNDGAQATVTLTIPSGIPSGDFAVLRVLSYHEDATCYPPLTDDDYHFWIFGLYVP